MKELTTETPCRLMDCVPEACMSHVCVAGDNMAWHNGMMFTTRDQDNDLRSFNCAGRYDSAWWYKGCYTCNLNGPYVSRASGATWAAIHWGNYASSAFAYLKFTEMKIRPRI